MLIPLAPLSSKETWVMVKASFYAPIYSHREKFVEHYHTVVVGGGQAGFGISYFLNEKGLRQPDGLRRTKGHQEAFATTNVIGLLFDRFHGFTFHEPVSHPPSRTVPSNRVGSNGHPG